jgi:hypothetical protein
LISFVARFAASPPDTANFLEALNTRGEVSMRTSVLLVGDNPALLHSRVVLLQDLAQIKLAISGDAEAAIMVESYDLVVLCQTVPEQGIHPSKATLFTDLIAC